MKNNILDIGELSKSMESPFFLIGLLNEFTNRFQVAADIVFGEITWKQRFAMICMSLFTQPPTINELAEVIGSSHQNVKQILLKLEKTGYIEFIADGTDKRKKRITFTQKGRESMNDSNSSMELVNQLFAEVDQNELKTTVKVMVQLDQKLKEMKESL